MDTDLSFYGTIVALIMLSAAYFWLHKDDYETIQLAKTDIRDQRLAILIVAANHRRGDQVKQQLESKGFTVYDIYFTGENQTTVKESSIQINPKCLNHSKVAAKFIKSKLESTGRKLHAYIALPVEVDSATNFKSPAELLRECLLPKFDLLGSLLDILIEHKTRLIHIQDGASTNANLSRLVRATEGNLNQYLRKEWSQVGQSLIEVIVQESDAGSLRKALRVLTGWGSDLIQQLSRMVERQLELEGSFVFSVSPGLDNGAYPITRELTAKLTDRHPKELNPSERIHLSSKIVPLIVNLVGQVHLRKGSLIV